MSYFKKELFIFERNYTENKTKNTQIVIVIKLCLCYNSSNMIALGKTLPIMLSGGWLTMMLSSVGPVNSLARVQVVDNHVVLCRACQ